MEYRVVELDFIEQSLAILKQYDRYVLPSIPKNERYEVTLLLNTLLGLIIVPFEHRNREQPRNQRQGDQRFPMIFQGDEVPINTLSRDWGLAQLQIKKFLLDGRALELNEITVRKIVAMFRHGMAHSQFGDGKRSPQGVSVDYRECLHQPTSSMISHINFINNYKDQRHSVEFEATISCDGLRSFATKIAEMVLAAGRM